MPDASYFQSRVKQYSKKLIELNKWVRWLALARSVVFLAGVVLIIYLANERNASAIFFSATATIIIFTVLVKIHNRTRYRRNHAEFLIELNQNEIKRIDGDITSFDQGEEFIDDEHNYSSDLDIFGKNSIFQLVNRTATKPGRRLMAKWLKSPAGKQEILYRQEAVNELCSRIDWRQEFLALALHSKDHRSDFSVFNSWIHEPSVISSSTFFRVSSYVFPALTLLSIAGLSFSLWPVQVVVVILVINGIVLSRTLKLASETADKASKSIETIASFESLIKAFESTSFDSRLLNDILKSLNEGNVRASGEIMKLSALLQKFDSRGNMLFGILDLLFLLDIHWLIQSERWKIRNRDHVMKWIDSLSKLDVLISFASSLHTHEEYILPEISDDHTLVVKLAGHPMIEPGLRVCNDFQMNGLGSEVIITGSNMSGKSTFLRTLGVNMVLALAGGPVCCEYALIPVMSIYTSMRTKDNLEEHISSFYAELKRIKGLLNLFDNSSLPVFYLLDEILKGTNSEDRHLGAESLVLQLLSLPGMGLISTHDLSLSALEEQNDKIENYSFNSSIDGEEIRFDYKIRKGVCKGFNASKLMEKMGIELRTNND